jgi:hypothetical protein
MRRITLALTAAAAVAATTVAVTATAASASSSTVTAVTAVSGRSDSGANGGTWATDQFNRTASVTGHGVVAASHCPGIAAGSVCHYLTGLVTDKGTFTTIPGALVPGKGSLNGGSAPAIGAVVSGPMTGSFHYAFYSDASVAAASAARMPAVVTGDSLGTGTWVEQFFPAGTSFWDASGNTGGAENLGTTGIWNYTAPLGSDSQCPNVSGRWTDGYPDWGSAPVNGNILAPSASSC